MSFPLHRRNHRSTGRQFEQNTLVHVPVQADAETRRAIGRELTEVIEQPNLALVGLCYTHMGDAADRRGIGATIDLVISLMEQVRREHGLILCELVIEIAHRPAGHEAELIESVDEALDAACAVYRFPRPSVTFMTKPAVLAEAGAAQRAG
ncbi:decarboxylase [Rhodococcus sp. NPDC127528]|uniref:decarboxylase n=1 Tax=unclassified Rhodococcus (in: high G+C Gram-positive bacteria) TaxID=192944 RepID=UPI00362514A6